VIESDTRNTALAELEQLYNAAPVGLCFVDRDLRYVRINEHLAAINGLPVADHIGKSMHEVIPEIAKIIEPTYRRVIDTGVPSLDMEVQGTTTAHPGEKRIYLVSYLPVTRSDEVLGVNTMVQDITEKRALQAQLLRTAMLEQRRIGQELHDVIGQELLGLGYLAQSLGSTLEKREPAAATEAERIVEGLERTLSKVRSLSKGLIPVEVTGKGLAAALRSLADQVNSLEEVHCSASCDQEVVVDNDAVATQLYRIAQESITNALKHSRAREIRISLEQEGSLLNLKILDDGVGVGSSASSPGVGRQIMVFRAEVIGGTLKVEQPAEGGTLVTCTLTAERSIE